MSTTDYLLITVLFVTASLFASISLRKGARRKQSDRLWSEAARLRLHADAIESFPILERAFTYFPPKEYISKSEVQAWLSSNPELTPSRRISHLAEHLDEPQSSYFRTWSLFLENLSQNINEHNELFVSNRMEEDELAFRRVERYPLTPRQRRAIVTNEDTTLVIAGAGTGKTSTIVGRVDYLMRWGMAQPSEILILAYGRKAADDLKVRLKPFIPEEEALISTFHALGRLIISEVEEGASSISPMAEDSDELKRFVRTHLRALLSSPDGQHLMTSILAEHLDEREITDATPKPPQTGDEAIRAERARGLRAINGKKLKSREEVQIANWLTLSGIAWEYERTYPISTATRRRGAYKPDFYLPEYDLYIEHFGVDRNGQTAPQIDAADYNRAMQWKRNLHHEHGTTLVETFSYYRKEGVLIAKLQALLLAHQVQIRPLTESQIDQIASEANHPFSDFIGLLNQFLNLFKSNGASREDIEARVTTERERVFLTIFWSVYDAYSDSLASSGDIDFNDMINKAREYVRSGQWRKSFTHIIVDEFQDISENRLGLLQELRSQRAHGRLYVVGDDWQSIYRFTGSDVGIITHLPPLVGATARVDLDVAFRYPQELLDLSSKFVMKNDAQLRKRLQAHQGKSGQLPVCLIFERTSNTSRDATTSFDLVFDEISRQVNGEPATAFVLGRYRHNRPTAFANLQRRFNRIGVSLEFLTAHSSKGKEADFVILTGLEAGEFGFPSNIADDPVMRLVLSADESYPYAEERRLFYVAITRARKRVFLVAPADQASPFVYTDILGENLRPFVETIGEVSERHHCPKCRGRTIRRTQGQYGTFWSCANYPLCYGKLDACPRCGDGGLLPTTVNLGIEKYRCTNCEFDAEVCPKCSQGYLRSRTGKYGNFLSCSRWNGGDGCTYKRNT